jgi:peptide/nickel transport system substrate-binding protein
MRRRKTIGLAAVGAAAALALAACGGSSGGGGSGGGGSATKASFNAGVTQVVNPSSHKGGTLNFASSSGIPDSTDPSNTYYAQM